MLTFVRRGRREHGLTLVAALVLTVLAILISSTSAFAAVFGRLDGSYNVAESVTSATNVVGESVGDSANVTWQFQASCASGPCPTTLIRHLLSNGQTLTYNLSPATDGVYRTTGGTRSSDCLNADGSVRLAGGYTVTDTISVEPTAVNPTGTVSAWTGALSAHGSATQAALDVGCAASQELITLIGTLSGPAWTIQPPKEVLRPVLGVRTFTVQARSDSPGPVLLTSTAGRNVSCAQVGTAPERPTLLCTLTTTASGGTLTFTATDSHGQSLVGATSVVADVKYVSLGDSYAAGEGNPPFVNDGYDTAKDGCHRSFVAASRLLSALTTARFRHVACSGAVVANLAAGKSGEASQFNALDRSTSLVTLSVGGNDVGFADIVANCALSHGCNDQLARARTNLDALTSPSPAYNGYSPLEYAYRTIRILAPNARIVVTGYPLLFPAKWSSTCVPFTPGDTRAINDITREGDRRIALTAQAVGADYVDLTVPFGGHAACQDRISDEWINYIVPRHKEYSFHPNLKGQIAIARQIADTVLRTPDAKLA